MNDEKLYITIDEAIALLPEGDDVHTFRQSTDGAILIGADHDKSTLIENMRRAPHIEVAGERAQSIGHGLAIKDEIGLLFIKAKRYEEKK